MTSKKSTIEYWHEDGAVPCEKWHCINYREKKKKAKQIHGKDAEKVKPSRAYMDIVKNVKEAIT